MAQSDRVFGEIEEYPEGSMFTNRAELSLARVHRPTVAGICGSGLSGAESIVLSGGYEDDEDYGNVIVYTGHGGNDMQTGQQVRDQELERGNLALAHNSLAGLPVRVIRGARHISPHSPRTGFRYDGLYRVEEFWCDRGKSGFLIWRFRLVKITDADNLSQLSNSVEEEATPYQTQPPRQTATVTRIIRDTKITRRVKQIHNYACQVCGLRLETSAGAYAEAAHIKPLGRPHNGPDTIDNVICLCPNHHVLFDRGAFTLDNELHISTTGQSLRTVPGHTINIEYVRYHREHYGPSESSNRLP